jgi:hypothetical protein
VRLSRTELFPEDWSPTQPQAEDVRGIQVQRAIALT